MLNSQLNKAMIMKLKSLLSVLAMGGLMMFQSCGDKKSQPASGNTAAAATTKIAYVNLDTLDARYQYILDGKIKFEAEQKAMEAELKQMEQAIKGQYATLQKKVNDKSISQVEYETIGGRIQSMEQNYQQKMQGMSSVLMAKTDSFQTDYRKKVDDFLASYNKDGKYDYILSYQYGVSLVLYANPVLDITNDVVNGLNELYKKGSTSTPLTPAAPADSTKK